MKSVLISIHPKWCELIASGEKTIEVRKSAPQETPFKVYIYCTRGGEIIYGDSKTFVTDNSKSLRKSPTMEEAFEKHSKLTLWNGRVIGEFMCDGVYQNMSYDSEQSCVSVSELRKYANCKPL